MIPNTGRNQFRGPGNSQFNARLYKSFHIWREADFQLGLDAINLFNHPFLNSPNTTVPTDGNLASGAYGTFGLITSFGQAYSQTGGTRALQFSGRINF
ncbi:MAG: hypothetical protein ABSE53_14330 [Terracidiphilus sp.]